MTLLILTELNLKGLGYWKDPLGTAAKWPGTRHCKGAIKSDLIHADGELAKKVHRDKATFSIKTTVLEIT